MTSTQRNILWTLAGWGIAIILFAALVGLSGCSTLMIRPGEGEPYQVRPGAYDAFDSRAYDDLIAANVILEEARFVYDTISDENQAKPVLRDIINTAGQSYNALRGAYFTYRAFLYTDAMLAQDPRSDPEAREAQRVALLDAMVREQEALDAALNEITLLFTGGSTE